MLSNKFVTRVVMLSMSLPERYFASSFNVCTILCFIEMAKIVQLESNYANSEKIEYA